MTKDQLTELLREHQNTLMFSEKLVTDIEKLFILAGLEELDTTLSKEEIARRVERLRPIMFGTKGGDFDKVFSVKNDEYTNPYWVSVGSIFDKDFGDIPTVIREACGLSELATIKTYHKCSNPALICPSIAEIVMQIPAKMLSTACAFSISCGDCTDGWQVYDRKMNRHVLETKLYSGVLPSEILMKKVQW